MKKLFFIILLFSAAFSQSQVKSVSLQASGLTCSMCSNAIYKALQSLPFVEKVEANVQNSSFTIYPKAGATVDLDKIKDKVEDAGFSVSTFSAIIHFNDLKLVNDSHVNLYGATFHFLNISNQTLTGDQMIKVIDKGFVSAKNFKKNGRFTSMECYKTGMAGPCCTKDGLSEGTRIYHVTI